MLLSVWCCVDSIGLFLCVSGVWARDVCAVCMCVFCAFVVFDFRSCFVLSFFCLLCNRGVKTELTEWFACPMLAFVYLFVVLYLMLPTHTYDAKEPVSSSSC